MPAANASASTRCRPHSERALQAETIGTRTGGAVIKDLFAPGRGECIELQRRIMIDRTDAGMADEGHECPPFRPAIILSDVPFSDQHFRTEREWPFIERLTDTPQERAAVEATRHINLIVPNRGIM
jgi:hypothetical protein